MAPKAEPARVSSRPLSPHLQIYRWPLTMLTSILHRVTGIVVSAGAVLLTAWLVAAANGPDTYNVMREALASILGRIVLLGLTLSLVYHLLNGIRHLAWDTGAGFKLPTARLTGYLVFLGTILLTAGIWLAAYMMVRGQP